MTKPILFNTDMVKAILEGRKTVTRRAIKGYIPNDAQWGYTAFTPKGYISCRGDNGKEYGEKFYKLPYQPGDILYVRETWRCWRAHRYEATADIEYKAGGDGIRLYFSNGSTDNPNRDDYDSFIGKWWTGGHGWKPSIHMPKEAARIFLWVTNVSVARIQDITTKDMQKEGLTSMAVFAGDKEIARQEWALLWDCTITGKDYNKFCFSSDPWVWVIEFERTEKPNGI